jgi:hypothetical protein
VPCQYTPQQGLTVMDVAGLTESQRPQRLAGPCQTLKVSSIALGLESDVDVAEIGDLRHRLWQVVQIKSRRRNCPHSAACSAQLRAHCLPAPGDQPSSRDHLCRLIAVRCPSRRTRSQDRDGATTCGTFRAPTGRDGSQRELISRSNWPNQAGRAWVGPGSNPPRAHNPHGVVPSRTAFAFGTAI